MSKIIALQSRIGKLAKFLQEHGYTVIDMYEAKYPGQPVDAFLYTGYHPDMVPSPFSLAESADITLGNHHHEFQDHTTPLMLNITGLKSEQVLELLRRQLPSRHFNTPGL